MVALTSRVISQKFRTLLMLTLSPATSVLASVVWAGHVIYMASIVGRLTGWHRLCCVPVDFTDWLPDGRKVLSSDFKSADMSILLPTHTPPRVSSLFFYFPTLHPLFFLLLLPPNLSDWCHPTPCAPQVATDLCSVRMQTWIIGITILHSTFPPCFYPFSACSLTSSFIWHPLTSPPGLSQWHVALLAIMTAAGGLFKVNYRVRSAMSAALMFTYIFFLSSVLPFFPE